MNYKEVGIILTTCVVTSLVGVSTYELSRNHYYKKAAKKVREMNPSEVTDDTLDKLEKKAKHKAKVKSSIITSCIAGGIVAIINEL